jgi:hypothetical protein
MMKERKWPTSSLFVAGSFNSTLGGAGQPVGYVGGSRERNSRCGVIPSGTVHDRLQLAFRPTQHGVVGLTEQLLGACVGGDVEFERVGDRCVYRWTEAGDTQEALVPFAPAAFRAIPARVAALCNDRSPGSVFPYGGEAELVVREAELLVKFINTADVQKLAVKNVPGWNTVPQHPPAKEDAVTEWKPRE